MAIDGSFAGPTPEIFKGYSKDHVDLLVRYMFQLTPEEQRQLVQRLPTTTPWSERKPPCGFQVTGHGAS